ncbi:hypothetical protein BT96DRAFT_1008929 [Gymnopus androsaceus JB14]|uniref:Uncharacterized protein n=1 Tax=Gymnopus androsaceus JB14 TaxID=1447944 RepID=A0A6A4GDZ5_9AGAR|nr:hypothetical protein BT96DRAFT_1008929 [Gymnopus androsaceus JB14]
MEQDPSGPSKKSRIIPLESDELKDMLILISLLIFSTNCAVEQANALFSSILHTEVTPPSLHRPSSPTRPPVASTSAAVPISTPTWRRLFAYSSPSHSNPSTPSARYSY